MEAIKLRSLAERKDLLALKEQAKIGLQKVEKFEQAHNQFLRE
jgi:hypothetical protein